MSRTYKDIHDHDSGRSASVNENYDRLRKDKAYAALLGFYTGVDEAGKVTSEQEAARRVFHILNRGHWKRPLAGRYRAR